MLHSMTGFGRGMTESPLAIQQWEIRSVNSRYLEIKWKLPSSIRFLEPLLEKNVRRHAFRGRLEINLYLRFTEKSPLAPALDTPMAESMLKMLGELARMRGDTFTPDYTLLLSIPSLWLESQCEYGEEFEFQLQEGLNLAIADWNEVRALEGEALGTDLSARIARMQEWTETIKDRVPEITAIRTRNLEERLNNAISGLEIEESRLLQEIVILADKMDVTEELTRLEVHLERLRNLLEEGICIGRKLEFTLQECFREINTCGNKLLDSQISGIVVDFKNELEKCREQAMNLE